MACKFTKEELKQICKYEHISCSGTKEELCKRVMTHIKKLGENKQVAKNGVYSPEKYFSGLTPKEREKRLREIRRAAKASSDSDPSEYKPFSTDFEKSGKRKPTRTSSYTQAFYDTFPNAKSLEDKAKVTGIPLDILKRVYNKGLAAWRTGHRPGATQGQWGAARVHSFIMKGCTFYNPDHKEAEEAMKRSTKAKKHWSRITCMCKKGCK